MAYLVEVPVDGAPPVLMEVAEVDDGVVRASRPGEVVATAAESFQAALARFRPMASAMVTQFRELGERPQEISVEFGLKLTAEAGMVIAQTGGEANFKVSLVWRSQPA
jgi:alkanesulfonate monooxygenase SsuD/methylene tetrahydromethanopterin reductase-like flavin-dependent oxidoreductase (luciferase family)